MSDLAQGAGHRDATGRAQVSDLYGLFTVSMMMFGERDGAAIMRLCVSSFPSLGSLRVEAAYLNEANSMVPVDIGRAVPDGVASQLARAAPRGGRLDVPGAAWGCAIPLTSLSGCRGYLAVSAPEVPQKYELFLLDVLIRQTAAALDNAVLHREVAQYTAGLQALNEERAAVNQQLTATVQDLERRTRMHEMLTEASELNRLAGQGPQSILCVYNLSNASGSFVLDILKVHPRVFLGGLEMPNPYYLTPDEFLAMRSSPAPHNSGADAVSDGPDQRT